MLRDAIADQLNSAVGGVIDTIMKGIWAASVVAAALGVPARRLVHHPQRRQRRRRDRSHVPDRHDLAADALGVAGDRDGPVLPAARHHHAARRPRDVPARDRPPGLRHRRRHDRRRDRAAVRRRRRAHHHDAGPGLAGRRVRRGPRLPGRGEVLHPRPQPRRPDQTPWTPCRRRPARSRPARSPASSTRPRGRSSSASWRCSR